ncbi:MAG TPA: [citrate (pro-3S)-lyase] ligase [Candidatus Blautia stercoravium]|nr:[citrate (pro-3S)-lyase] ligase [Candidatus Blautia stercoravium]
MDSEHFYLEEGFPFHGRKLEKLKAFLVQNDLSYDTQIQYSVLLKTQSGELAGCGSRHENTLKCIAINPKFQGEGCLSLLMTQLIKNAAAEGLSHLFLFTKPMYMQMFSDMGFYPITQTEDMLLMENRRDGIREYVTREAALSPVKEGKNIGAIVMNANPFTNGHRYLVKTAAAMCDLLHVFVLSADSSEFPADIRLKLVKEGCTDFPNVQVHGSSEYLISHATFPDYFLKDKATVSDKTALLDLMIFGTYFKEAFHITRRFVGEEPFSSITKAYNEQMKKTLPAYGIEVTEIPRCSYQDTIISATFVRKKFLSKNPEDIKELQNFVPQTTYAFLISPEGQHLKQQLSATGDLS